MRRAVARVSLVAAVLGIPNGFNNIGNQAAMYRQADASDAGMASGLYRTSQYVGANVAAAVIELGFGGAPADPGLHRLGTVVAVISVLLLVGALCLAGAWFYTGGGKPYGYAGLGEIAVFVFFGLVAVLGTMFVLAGTVSGFGIGAAVATGSFSSAVLVANNLRDIPGDRVSGKRTLAVLLGDRDTRTLYLALVFVPFLITLLTGLRNSWALLGFLALPLLINSVRAVAGGATGRGLIPALRDTGLAMLVWGAATGLALALG